ncbi:MAG TPA: hypothetical protein VGR27_07710 [Longimicrobiaceae bacterium]|nr:hypothetical protein [Longimicrobiaceae bacterium]
MPGDPFLAFPPRPTDLAEWEELLVRLELGPRALRFAMDDIDRPSAAVLEPLNRLVAMELWTARALDTMRRGGGAVPEKIGISHVDPADAAAGARKRLEEYVALRTDNFAALQRRGIQVWEWSAELEGGGTVTAYQVVRRALQIDGEVLRAVRAAGHEE